MEEMKTFISSAHNYSKSFQEDDFNSMRSNLQTLSGCTELSVFDPDSILATNFYCQLHEVLKSLVTVPGSSLVWNSISALHQACQNPSARVALLHTHRFAAVLARLLVAGASTLPVDRKIQLLELLQELTYGIKITWQEAQIPGLINTLVSWVCNTTSADDGSKEVVELSLAVLVNLCHKNLPAFCMLARSIDTHTFLKVIVQLQDQNPRIRVQAFKMMSILKAGDIPEGEILNFCSSAFKTVTEALNSGDIFLLRQTADFCLDLFADSQSKDILLQQYKSFSNDLNHLINLLSELQQPKSIAIAFELLASAVAMGVTAIVPLYPDMISVAFRWVHMRIISMEALSLINAIVLDVWRTQDCVCHISAERDCTVESSQEKKDNFLTFDAIKDNILTQFESGLGVLVLILETFNSQTTQLPRVTEDQNRCKVLLQIFQGLIQASTKLRERIMLMLCHETVLALFSPLVSNVGNEKDSIFKEEEISFYVQALTLLSYLASYSVQWQMVYTSAIQHLQVHRLLANAILTESLLIKKQVLMLINNACFPSESLISVAKALHDMPNGKSIWRKREEMVLLFTPLQEGHLDRVIGKLEEAFNNDQINNITTAEVIDLYQCKLAALASSEHMLQVSLEAAEEKLTKVQQQLARSTAREKHYQSELGKVQQEVDSLQVKSTEASKTIKDTQIQLNAVQEQLTKELQQVTKLSDELSSREHDLSCSEEHISFLLNTIEKLSEEIEQKKDQLESVRQKLHDVQDNLGTLTDQFNKKVEECKSFSNENKELQEQITVEKTSLKQLNEQLKSKEEALSEAEKELKYLRGTVQCQDTKLKEQEAKLSTTLYELRLLHRIREQIYELSSGNMTTLSENEDKNS